MSEFRRRLMMVGGGGEESLPIANGMLYWLDGKDLNVGDTYWYTSSRVQCICDTLHIRFASSGNTIHAGEFMEVTGSNGGAHAQTTSTAFTSPNPFYTAGMSASDSVTMECIANVSLDNTAYLFSGISSAAGATAYWRYIITISTSGDLILNYVDGTGSWNRPVLYQGVNANTNYYFVFQRDGSTQIVYLNATKVYEGTDTVYKIPIVQKTGLIGIGRSSRLDTTATVSTGYYYSQSMYNRALSESEILHNYNVYFNRYNLA